MFHVMPEVVVLPAEVEQVAAVVKAARPAAFPIVPHGSETGLAGRKIAWD